MKIRSAYLVPLVFLLCFVIAPLTTHASYQTTVQSESGLLYYWPMTEASGASSSAAAVGSTPLTLSGATAGASGQVGTAVSFNGSNNYAASAAPLNLASYNKVVVEALVYVPSYANTTKQIWEYSPNVGGSSDTFYYAADGGINGTDSTANVALKGNSDFNIALYSRPSAGAWHHIVTVYDKTKSSNEVDFYVDGVLQSASSRPYNGNNTNTFGNETLYLMSRGGTTAFSQGSIQHLAIYSDLSDARILAHAQAAFGSVALTAGTLTAQAHATSTAAFTWTHGANGTAPITEQLQISAHGAGSWTDIAGATTGTATSTGLTPATSYDFRVRYTDASPTTVYSNTVTITTDGIADDSSYVSSVMSESNLKYFWKMNEASGSTLAATVGGTAINVTNATVGASGKLGNAVSFNGINSFGATASSIDLSAYNKLVVEALVYYPSYANSSGFTWEFSPNISGSNDTFFYEYDGGVDGSSPYANVALNGNGGFSIALYNRPTTGTWHHVAAVYDKSLSTNEVSFYVDGVLQSVQSRPYNTDSTNNFGNQVLYLFSRGGSSYFSQGKIQDLAIYSDLSPSRIAVHAALTNVASAVTLSGPSSGNKGVPSANFTVGTDAAVAGTVTVTPSDGGNGGTFLPASVTLSSSTPTATFTYTPASNGTKTISVTNNGGLSNPTSIAFLAKSTDPATAITLTGPASGSSLSASTAFTVDTDGVVGGTVVVTPSDGGAGGTFTPATLTLTSASSTGTFTYTPAAAGIKTITISNNGGLANPQARSYESVGSGLIIGDSTIATYAGGTQIASFLYTPAQTAAGWTATSIAVPGNTIAQQKSIYLSTASRSTVDFTIAEIGLNDIQPSEAASVAIARLQDLVNTINANKKPGSLTIISTMTPAKQRLIDIYGPTDGLVAQQKYLDMNDAIKGNGPTPITGVDYRISKHTALLDDGNQNLNPIYDTGDHIHENDAARQIMARVWRDSLGELSMLTATTSSAPNIGSATAGNGAAVVTFAAPTYTGGSVPSSYTVRSTPGNITATGSNSPITVTGLTNGTPYTFTVTATNAAGVSDPSSATIAVTPLDLGAPLITAVNAVPGNGSATITWVTDEPATSQVEYGTTSAYTASTTLNASLVTTHTVAIPGLTTGTYHFRVLSADGSGNMSTSTDYTFAVSAQVSVPSVMSTRTFHGGSAAPAAAAQASAGQGASPSGTATFTRSLTVGASGADVMQLQQLLIARGFLKDGYATGYFGALTKAALAAYQAASGITPAGGYFGPLTIASFSSAAPAVPVTLEASAPAVSAGFARDLGIGSVHADVRALQAYLNTHGFAVAASGAGSAGNETTVFGAATQAALKRLQQAAGIQPASGYFGPLTRAYLQAHP